MSLRRHVEDLVQQALNATCLYRAITEIGVFAFDRTHFYSGNGGKSSFPVCIFLWTQICPSPPQKKKKKREISSGTNDVISISVQVLAFQWSNCALLRTFEYWDRLLWTVADNSSLKSVLRALFKNLADMSSRNAYDFSYEQKAVVWLRVVYPLLFDQN